MKFSSKFTLAAIRKFRQEPLWGKNTPPPFVKLPTPGMCVYIHVYVFVGGCKHVFVCMCVHVFVYTCMSARVCVYVCVHVCVQICVCVCCYMKLTIMANFTCRYFRDQSAMKLNICKCPSIECFWKSNCSFFQEE